jgi:hypothetical protein
VGVASLLGLLLYWPVVFPLDDAYITLHNARVLLTGGDENYDVPALVGATSAVHLVLVAGLGLFLDLPLASFLLNALAAIAYAVGLARLALWAQSSRWVASGIIGLGLLAADAPYHLFNGLETGLAMAAVVWGVILALSGSQIILPVLCGLMPFIRPELAALAGSLLVWQAWSDRNSPVSILKKAALAALAASPWVIWYWTTTGHWIPLTASAKQAFFAQQGYPLRFKMWVVLITISGSGLGFLFVALIFVRRSPLVVPVFVFIGATLAAFVATFPGGLTHNHFRYLYPLLPTALMGLALAAKGDKVVAWGVGTLCSLYVAIGIGTWPHVIAGRHLTKELDNVAQWSREHLPPDARVLVHDAGYFAWATSLVLVDVVGLKTPSSIEDHRRWTMPSTGRNRHEAVHAIAYRSRVTHAVILNAEFWGDLANNLRQHGWTLRPIREPAAAGYVVYAISPPS